MNGQMNRQTEIYIANIRSTLTLTLVSALKIHIVCVKKYWAQKRLTSLRSSSMRRFLVAYRVGCAHGEGSLQWRFRSKPIKEHLPIEVQLHFVICSYLHSDWFEFHSLTFVLILFKFWTWGENWRGISVGKGFCK